MYQTIVAGTDGSASARTAVDHAAQLALLSGAELHLVYAVSATAVGVGADMIHALPPSWIESNLETSRDVLTKIGREIEESGVTVSTHLAQGEPAESLLRCCEELNADLLVVGDKGMHGPRRFLLGSVANRCAHHAKCAVLVVPTG